MQSLTQDTIRALVGAHEPPCISIYQPTHRSFPDNQQDPIRFKNLIKAVEESLRSKYPSREARPLIEPLRKLADDAEFWNHALDGLAVLGSADGLRIYQLQRPVEELAVVADSFHIKPLLRVVQSADRYQVLCVTRHEAKVYEGNRYALDPVDADGFPATIQDALGDELTEPRGAVVSSSQGGGAAIHFGGGSKKDEVGKDEDRYFRAVDREVIARFSKPSGLPLVLAALGEHQPVFRAVSHNPALIANGVDKDPGSMSGEQLRDAAWEAVEPRYLERLARLSDEFQAAFAHRKGTGDLADAARAAIEGRIGTLLIEADRESPGRIDPATGAIQTDALENPEVDDLLDDLAEIVLRSGGDVVIVPADRMPTKSGLAATYRY